MMRHAISPRLAIRIFLNLRGLKAIIKLKEYTKTQMICLCFCVPLLGLNSEERLAIFNRLAVLDVNLDYFTTGLSLNLIHELHRFDDTNHAVLFDIAADLHKRICVWRPRAVERADD